MTLLSLRSTGIESRITGLTDFRLKTFLIAKSNTSNGDRSFELLMFELI